MVFGVAVDLFTVGGDDVQPEHALACRAEHRTVPAVSALQEKAAQANAFAVARGKEQPLRVQFCREDAGNFAWANVCDHAIRLDSAVIEAADVEQQSTVAQVTCRPAVTARAHAHMISVGPRITDRGDHVFGVARLHDYIGISVPAAGRSTPFPDGPLRNRLRHGRRSLRWKVKSWCPFSFRVRYLSLHRYGGAAVEYPKLARRCYQVRLGKPDRRVCGWANSLQVERDFAS